MAVLDGQERVLDPLEHWLLLLGRGDVDLLLHEANLADGTDAHRRARAEHLQQLQITNNRVLNFL